MEIITINNYIAYTNKVLGQGRFTTIYEGAKVSTKEAVVIKKYSSPQMEKFIRDLIREEGKYLLQYKPLNYVEIICIEETKNSIYWITTKGECSLRLMLMKQAKLSYGECLKLSSDLLLAYSFMININILHQDLKPEGIILDQGHYKLTDLGLGNQIDIYLKQGHVSPYVSPQKLNNIPFTSKCDVWSLGVILYEAYFGAVPILIGTEINFPFPIDQSNCIESFIFNCLKYEEQDRLSWDQVFSHDFVQNILKLDIDNQRENNFEGLAGQFRETVKKVDLYLMFGLNSDTQNIQKLSKDEFIKGTQKAIPNVSKKSIIDLYHHIVGYMKDELCVDDITKWIQRSSEKLQGDRGMHRNQQKHKQELIQNQEITWKFILDSTTVRNVQLLSPKVIEILNNIKYSIEKFNTDLDQLFIKYDPNKIGGINKTNLDRILLKIYPEILDSVHASHTFLFLNQYMNGKISRQEFEFCLFKLDFKALKQQ